VWRNLFEQFHPFRAHDEFKLAKARGVAARPRQAGDETAADGIEKVNEHDRHCARCLQQRPDGRAARSQ
jgi:hypothetical protein